MSPAPSSKSAHLAMTSPNGGSARAAAANASGPARRGAVRRDPTRPSRSRVRQICSSAPTERKARAFASAWNTSSSTPAERAAADPSPAAAAMSPRVEMVE